MIVEHNIPELGRVDHRSLGVPRVNVELAAHRNHFVVTAMHEHQSEVMVVHHLVVIAIRVLDHVIPGIRVAEMVGHGLQARATLEDSPPVRVLDCLAEAVAPAHVQVYVAGDLRAVHVDVRGKNDGLLCN